MLSTLNIDDIKSYISSNFKKYEEIIEMKKINKLFYEKKIDNDYHSYLYYEALGLYYRDFVKDFDKMKYYFVKSMELSNFKSPGAMYNLGLYYELNKEYNDMKKYYLLVLNIELLSINNIVNNCQKRLFNYCKNIETNNNSKISCYIILARSGYEIEYITNELINYCFYNNINNEIKDYFINKKYILIISDLRKKNDMNIKKLINYFETNKKNILFGYELCVRFNIDNHFIKKQFLIISKKLESAIEDECPICFEYNKLIQYDCSGKHFFCIDCIYQLHNCAICRG
jgi:hypothetical protein